MNKKFVVSPEFITTMKEYTYAKETDTYRSIVHIYRGMKLSDSLIQCPIRAVLDVSNARTTKKAYYSNIQKRDMFFTALKTLREPYDDVEVMHIAEKIGFVQPETLVEIIDTIENLKKGMVDRTGESVSIIYNTPVIVRDAGGLALVKTMNDITIVGSDEVVILNTRTDSDIDDTIASYYISMLANMKRYQDKQVTVGTFLVLKSTQDVVIPVYWTASHELLNSREESWYDNKFYDFIYMKHRQYPKDIRADLNQLNVKRDGKCISCRFTDFCNSYIAEEKEEV